MVKTSALIGPRPKWEDLEGRMLRTLPEAGLVVTSTNWHRGERKERSVVYLIFEDGFLQWLLSTHGNGIVNYSENVGTNTYPRGLEMFIDDKLMDPRTIGFMPMDYEALEALKRRDIFDPEYLKAFIAIPKVHVQRPNPS